MEYTDAQISMYAPLGNTATCLIPSTAAFSNAWYIFCARSLINASFSGVTFRCTNAPGLYRDLRRSTFIHGVPHIMATTVALGQSQILVANMLKLSNNHYVRSINVCSDNEFETFVDNMNTIAKFKILTISWKIDDIHFSIMLNKKHVRKVQIKNAELAIKFVDNKNNIIFDQVPKSLVSKVKSLIMKHDDGWFKI